MTKKIIITFCVIAVCASISTGQIYLNSEEVEESALNDSNKYQISTIEIIGNNKTKPDIILRELHFAENDAASFKEIVAAFKRVQSLFLFNRVKFDIVGDVEYSVLLITVYERWYIFPIPLVYRNERNWRKISYGAKLLHYNFLGRNIILNFLAAFGYNPIFKFGYYNPWFMGDLKLFTDFSLFYRKVKSLSPQLSDYEDTRKGFEWLIGKRFGHFTYAGISFSYIELTAPAEIGLTLSANGKDFLPAIMFIFQFDNRDLKEYPHKGLFWNLWTKRAGNSGLIHYYRFGSDLRTYIPLNQKLTLALRGAVDLSSGKIPSYDRVFLGYSERIRGRYYEVYEGENFAFGGMELRFPIMKVRYIDIETLPDVEQYSSNLKFGMSAGIFLNSGAVWFQKETLRTNHFRSGFGAGIHFHLPYVEVFRLECGLNWQWRPEAIAEVEVAF